MTIMQMRPVPTMLAFAACMWLIGCAPLLPHDRQAFAELVHRRVAVGDPAVAAAAEMRALGLSVSESSPRSDSTDGRPYLFCTRTSPAFILMDREWRVILDLADDRVAEIVTQVNITGP
jgi:hypothetical protein